jgi:hypothetical protein
VWPGATIVTSGTEQEGCVVVDGTNANTPSTASEPAATLTAEGLQAIVESAWQDQVRWSMTASRLKSRLGLARVLTSVGGVTGALLDTIAAAIGENDPANIKSLQAPLAIIGAVILAASAYVLRTQLSQDRVQAWIRARSVSEALKEETYRFLVGATPYAGGRDPKAFEENLEKLKSGAADFSREVAAIPEPAVKGRPVTPMTVADYIDDRVNGQMNRYYYPRAKWNSDRGNLFRNVEFVLGALAVVIGAVAASDFIRIPILGSMVAVVTTATAAVTAFLVAGRYDYQAISYFGTAERLKALKNGFVGTARTPEATSAFVDKCEQAISSENEAWLASWSKDAKPTEA